MWPPNENESTALWILRWTARGLSCISLGLLLLFITAEDFDLSKMKWEDVGVLIIFPIAFTTGLVLAWQEELKGGALAVTSIAVFYLVEGLIIRGSLRIGWWFLVIGIPGALFLLYGVLAASRTKASSEQEGMSKKLAGREILH